MKLIKRDTELLCKQGLIDYSMLLAIEDKESEVMAIVNESREEENDYFIKMFNKM